MKKLKEQPTNLDGVGPVETDHQPTRLSNWFEKRRRKEKDDI